MRIPFRSTHKPEPENRRAKRTSVSDVSKRFYPRCGIYSLTRSHSSFTIHRLAPTPSPVRGAAGRDPVGCSCLRRPGSLSMLRAANGMCCRQRLLLALSPAPIAAVVLRRCAPGLRRSMGRVCAASGQDWHHSKRRRWLPDPTGEVGREVRLSCSQCVACSLPARVMRPGRTGHRKSLHRNEVIAEVDRCRQVLSVP